MPAKYLVRLDDACETACWKKWNKIINVLIDLNIKPIVAVIPENRDEELLVDEPDQYFWDRVRQWDKKGWTIGMHGLNHAYHYVDRRKQILPFHERSEFSGASLAVQTEKLKKSFAIFKANDVTPEVFVAPSHGFDHTTVKALKLATNIRIISDGIGLDLYSNNGVVYIPQQLWWPKKKRRGLWTICIHPNKMKMEDIISLQKSLKNLQKVCEFVCVKDLNLEVEEKKISSKIYAFYFWAIYEAKLFLKRTLLK